MSLLASITILHTFIIAKEEFSIEQLNGDDSKNKMKEKVDDEDVEDILEWINNTVKYSLELWNSFYSFERTQDSKHS